MKQPKTNQHVRELHTLHMNIREEQIKTYLSIDEEIF